MRVLCRKKTILILMFLFVLSVTGFRSKSFADWQGDLAARFDIVETFDQLQDWAPKPNRGRNYSGLPVLENGKPSMWNLYDYWPTGSPDGSPWIGNHGSQNVWRGNGKSLVMDLDTNDSTPNNGPARFGLYFGTDQADGVNAYSSSGIVSSGYRKDVYIFYMVKFPAEAFPKSGSSFSYFDYYKFNTLSTGFLSAGVSQEGSNDYGSSNIHTNIAAGASYSNQLHFVLQYFTDANWSGVADPNIWHANNTSYISPYIDKSIWFGVEIHVHRGTPGGGDGFQELWIYSPDGSSVYGGKTANYSMVPDGKDWGFNRFWFGGNRSFGTGDSTYYIDDFIINDSRIGPTYFGMLSGQVLSTPPPAPTPAPVTLSTPKNLIIRSQAP